MSDSPFAPVYRSLEIELAPGVLPPVISDFEEEYRAATEGALALDRSQQGTLRVTGKDRRSFLHNMLTNDVRSLPVLSGLPAAFLTNKGKLVSDLLVLEMEDETLLETELSRLEPLRKALDRYVISEDVALESLTDREAAFSVEGPKASERLARLGAPSGELDALGHLETRMLTLAGAPARVTAKRRELTPRFDVTAGIERVAALLEAVLADGALLGGEQVAETRRLEASRPRFGVDMDESNLPLEAGLDEAIHFQKGCYIGQEYVVRLAHRGHLNRKLVGLLLNELGAPERGALVRHGDVEVGALTSAASSPAFGRALAFAHVRREAFEPGTAVEVDRADGSSGATVVSLPFERPA